MEDHKGMRRPIHCRLGTCYGLLLLGLFQASGCTDGSIPLLTSPLLSLIKEENRPPSSAVGIPATHLTVGGDGARVDVAQYFSDPDDDTLRYSVVSSDVGVVMASVSGSIVTLRPVNAGIADATVTATDPDGLFATLQMIVTVRPGETPASRPACRVGLVLRIGESCTVDIPSVSVADSWFQVTSDGSGCYETICSNDVLNLDGFRASRHSDGGWRIDALPEGGGAGLDLIVESPEVSSPSVAPGGPFTLSATVRNQGAGRSESTTLRYYRSSDATISTGDAEVGTDFVFPLAAGESGLESIRLTAPGSPGTYYYGACVEPVSGESDTGNNCSAGVRLTVAAVPGSDLVVESPELTSSTGGPGGVVHAVGHRAEPGRRPVRVDDAPLLPFVGRDDFDGRYGGGHGRRVRAGGRRERVGVDSVDGAELSGDVLLRRLRGAGERGERHRQQLFGWCLTRRGGRRRTGSGRRVSRGE